MHRTAYIISVFAAACFLPESHGISVLSSPVEILADVKSPIIVDSKLDAVTGPITVAKTVLSKAGATAAGLAATKVAAVAGLAAKKAAAVTAVAAKVAAVKAPFIAAKLAVAHNVKGKAINALVKKAESVKATSAAVKAIASAPFVVAKKAAAITAGGLGALAAAKVAAVKGLVVKSGLVGGAAHALPVNNAIVSTVGSVGGGASGFLQSLVSGAQSTIQSIGGAIPFLGTLQSGISSAGLSDASAQIYTPSVQQYYQVIPDLGATSYQSVKVPGASYEIKTPHIEYGAPKYF